MNPFHDPALVSQEPGVLTVWSDIGCPWATLALHTLHSRAQQRDIDLVVDHRAFPLELFNRRPTPKPVIEAEITAIAGLVPELGWRSWESAEWEYAVTTVPALAAVQAAKSQDVGGLRASDALDTALRRAFYEGSRCISIHAEILEVAEECPTVFVPALAKALQRGERVAEVFGQWQTAAGLPVRGSPHLFLGDRYAEHNPGVTYHWTAAPGTGFPRFEKYDRNWADEVLDHLAP